MVQGKAVLHQSAAEQTNNWADQVPWQGGFRMTCVETASPSKIKTTVEATKHCHKVATSSKENQEKNAKFTTLAKALLQIALAQLHIASKYAGQLKLCFLHYFWKSVRKGGRPVTAEVPQNTMRAEIFIWCCSLFIMSQSCKSHQKLPKNAAGWNYTWTGFSGQVRNTLKLCI